MTAKVEGATLGSGYLSKCQHDETAGKTPRLLVFDITRRSDGTATGEIKATLFAGWLEAHFIQFYSLGYDRIGVDGAVPEFMDKRDALTAEDISRLVRSFAPEVILYRPVPNNLALHEAAMGVIRSADVPLAIWIMDDWPSQLAAEDPQLFARLDSDLRELLARADLRLSICDAMSIAFAQRYNVPFKAFANAIDPQDWPPRRRGDTKANTFVLRYAGALAKNMVLDSVRRTAQAIERLSSRGVDIRFEITTHPCWQKTAEREFNKFHRTSISTLRPHTAYREWLSQADALLIAYNFDEASKNYVRYSLANKLPECLASGAVVIAHGPSDVATIDYIRSLDCAVIATEADEEALATVIKGLVEDPDRRHNLSEKARAVAFDVHNVHRIRRALHAEFLTVAARRRTSDGQAQFPEYERTTHAHIDETQVISTLFSPSTDIELVMIDVGAHFGSSARHFVEETWRVYCFEPDPGNRQRLIAQFGRVPNVVIDARAVGAQTEKGKPLFSSPESTGISALHAFRDTHQQVGLVDVTTITEIVKEHKLDRIDFLKIDVEGHDFAVLRGVPWDLIKPAVIECEFEDAKTVPLGHTWKDIAEFLVAKGYVVYVSEWYPIIRYGIQHDWRRLFRYPGALRDPQAWGNLLAFREDPGTEAIADALRACVKVKHPQIACQTEPTQPPQPSGALAKNGEAVRVTSQAAQTHEGAVYVRNAPKETPVAHVKVGATPQHQEPASKEMTAKITPNPDSYRRHADKLTDKHTMLRPFFRFCDWSVGAIARHWLGVSGAVVMAGILLGAAFWVAPALWPYWLIVLGLFISSGVLFLCVGYGQHFFSRYAEKQAAELGQQTVGVARLQGDIARLRSEIGSVVSTLRNVCASVDKDPQLKELQERCKTLEAQISAHVDAVRIRQDALDNTIAARVDELERGLASVQAASESADRVLDDVRAQAADALETVRNSQAALDTMMAAQVEEIKRRLTASADGVLDDVRAQAADALETVRNSQAARDTMMAAQVEEIKRRLTASADGVLDDVRTQAAAIKALAAEAVDAVRSQDAAFRKLNASNASLARPFNRFLSTDHIRRLQQHWSKVFGVTMSPSAISYLAHRMCTAEDQCEGRIACSIETAILRQYASRSLKGDRIDVLEIGALFGLGAAFLYKFAAPGQSGIRLTLIDPLEGYYGHDVDPITGVPVDRRTLESNFEALKIPSKDWRLIQRLSTDPVAAQEAADRQYDLILIDGDHSGAGVARDYEIYGSMVKPGGLIIFDDYDSASWPSIKPFVDEHVKTDGRWIWIGAEWNTAILRRRYDEAYVRADEPEGVQ